MQCVLVCVCLLPWAAATAAPAEAAGVGPLRILGGGHAPPPSRPAQCRGLAATSPHGQLAPSLGRDRTCVLHGQREKERERYYYFFWILRSHLQRWKKYSYPLIKSKSIKTTMTKNIFLVELLTIKFSYLKRHKVWHLAFLQSILNKTHKWIQKKPVNL